MALIQTLLRYDGNKEVVKTSCIVGGTSGHSDHHSRLDRICSLHDVVCWNCSLFLYRVYRNLRSNRMVATQVDYQAAGFSGKVRYSKSSAYTLSLISLACKAQRFEHER